ncbi:MAG: response regulator [Nitrososphaeraceae archaeon]|nr:response regulator [Nitrososphaeraceae archaeon]
MGQKEVQKQKGAIKEKRVRSQPELASNRILIAEDDEDTALTYKMALKDAGYEAKIVDNGEDCAKIYLEKFQEFRLLKSKKTAIHPYDQPFEVVILDYRMPRMDGLQVAKEILTVNPRQRIIFASAYVKETLKDSVKGLKQVVELLQKPFSSKILVDTIRDKQVYKQLKHYKVDTKMLQKAELTHEQLMELLNIMKRARD